MGNVNSTIIEEFRANGGHVGGMFEGAPLLLLTTTGARSGSPHTTPAAYTADGDRLLVYGTNAGQDRHPAWFHNLRAHPQVIVELGDESFPAVASEVAGPERDRLYAELVGRDPGFAHYAAQTQRVIPVIALHRVTRSRAAAEHLQGVHAGLRRELAELRRAVDEYLTGRSDGISLPKPELGESLRRHCLTFCTTLHAHHHREDGVLDMLAGSFPALGDALDRLRREHSVVADLNDRIAALVDDLGSGADGHLRAELERLSGELDAHFAYEEKYLGPALDAA